MIPFELVNIPRTLRAGINKQVGKDAVHCIYILPSVVDITYRLTDFPLPGRVIYKKKRQSKMRGSEGNLTLFRLWIPCPIQRHFYFLFSSFQATPHGSGI